MKYIHLIAALCVASPALGALSSTTDAHTIAQTIHTHMHHNVDPHYYTLQKSLKAVAKDIADEAKKSMRDAQKKAQADCSLEKKRLQELCNELKKALFSDYLSMRTTQEKADREAGALLHVAHNKAHHPAPTLAALLSNSSDYLEVLLAQAIHMGNKEATTNLTQDKEWFTNLKKSSAKAGISLDEKLITPSKKEPKAIRHKKA
ncbi:MAG: hypothetical protein QG604_603 [Candidatus Dependentiae bacterium]|nr:hypothetical protein [Candidatus Dependentiae bacterium]